MYKKGRYIAARIVFLLAIILLGAGVALQAPYVQMGLARKAIEELRTKMDGTIEFDNLEVMSGGVLTLSNLVVLDAHPVYAENDTLAKVGRLTATFSIKGLFKKQGIHMGRVTVKDGYLHISAEDSPHKMNLNRVFGMPVKEARTTIPAPGPDIFDINKVWIENFRFRLTSSKEFRHRVPAVGINFEDMDVVADVKAHSVRMTGGKMSGTADMLSAREKSGYIIDNLTGHCVAGQGKVIVDDLHLQDPWSDATFRYFTMTFDSPAAFLDYIGQVEMELEFERSRLAFETLKYFAGTFEGHRSVLDIRQGHAVGCVDDIKVDNLVFTDLYSGISGTADWCRVTGIPDMEAFSIDAHLAGFSCTSSSLGRFLTGFSPDHPLDFSRIAPGQNLIINAYAKGLLNNFSFRGSLASKIGEAAFTGSIANVLSTRTRNILLDAGLTTSSLDLGKVITADELGPCDLVARAHLETGNAGGRKTLDFNLDTLGISRLQAFGLEYKDISASASMIDGRLDASVNSNDRNLNLDLTALADLNGSRNGRLFRMNGNIVNADVTPFGVIAGDGRSSIAADLRADFYARNGILEGNGAVERLTVKQNGRERQLGDIELDAYTTGAKQGMKLESRFLEAAFLGSKPVRDFLNDLQAATSRREISALYTDQPAASDCGNYSLDLHFHDSRDLLACISPGLYVADSTMVSLTLDSKGMMDGSISSNRLASGTSYLKMVSVDMDNQDGSLNATIAGQELKAGPMILMSPGLELFADDNRFSIDISYDNSGIESTTGDGIIMLDGVVSRDSTGVLTVSAHPLDSYLTLEGKPWAIGESGIELKGKDISISNFSLSHADQAILVDGGISKSHDDTLSLKVSNLDLRIVNNFIQGLEISGAMQGSGKYTSAPGPAHGMLMDFRLHDIALGGNPLGDIVLSSNWDPSRKAISLSLDDRLQDRDIIRASGYYMPDSNEIELDARLDAMPVNVASVFTRKLFSRLDGSLSGGISLMGPMESLTPGSRNLRLDNAALTLGITGVEYKVNGPLRLNSSGLHFDSLAISDNAGGTGSAAGALKFDHLHDFALDARLTMNNLKAVDIGEESSSAFYGNLAMSGDAAVSGPLNAILVDASVRTSGNGDIHIPVSGKLTSAASDLLTFTEPQKEVDPYEEMLENYAAAASSRSDMTVRARLSIGQGTNAFVEIDKENGNMASFNGSGDVSITLRPSRDIFNINGDYSINEGKYQFVLPGILAKDFSIQNGSTVQFGGSIAETNLNINATHNVRTSLAPILPTQPDVGTRRLVECGIQITDRLSRPQLDFTVNVPDLDPTTKSDVEAALNTQDKIQKQFIALLLMNSFIPGETSGVFNGTNMIFSSVSELMSNQINSIFQKLEIPVDVGFGYQNSTTGSDIFDVAISTQLFNNRVIVGGTVGNRKYKTTSNANFVGDLDIQIKLDPTGRVRLNMFSHSADEFTNYIDNSQRNGVGISYQKEYSKLSDIFKGKNAQTEKAVEEKKDITIEIKK